MYRYCTLSEQYLNIICTYTEHYLNRYCTLSYMYTYICKPRVAPRPTRKHVKDEKIDEYEGKVIMRINGEIVCASRFYIRGHSELRIRKYRMVKRQGNCNTQIDLYDGKETKTFNQRKSLSRTLVQELRRAPRELGRMELLTQRYLDIRSFRHAMSL